MGTASSGELTETYVSDRDRGIIIIIAQIGSRNQRRSRPWEQGFDMGWADGDQRATARLARNETVQFRPRGNSMTGKIASGQVTPLAEHVLAVGDIVLCRVKGNQYLHLVKAIQGARFQIGNNRGGINGWVTKRQIFGRLVAVE
jgi:hypothetical protein